MSTPRNHRLPRRRTPTVLQSDSTECGAAALSIILQHYGRHVPMDALRQDCGISRDGSRAGNLLRAARRLGLNGDGYRVETEALGRFQAPLIVFWNFNHFVVLEGITASRAYINDPAKGPYSISLGEFDKSFTGVVLELRPGPDFKKGGRRVRLFRELLLQLTPVRFGLLFVFLAGLGLTLLGLLIPAFTRVFVDEVLIGNNRDWMKPLALAMSATLACFVAMRSLQARGFAMSDLKLTLVRTAAFMEHVLRLPYAYFVQRFHGDLATFEQTIGTTAAMLVFKLTGAAVTLSTAVLFALVMSFYDVTLAAIGMVCAVLNVIVLNLVARRRSDLFARLMTAQITARSTGLIGMQGIETIKATGAEGEFLCLWAGRKAVAKNVEQQFSFLTNLVAPIPGFLASLSTMAILGMGALKVMEGELTVGMLAAFQALMIAFLTPLGEAAAVGAEIQTLRIQTGRMAQFMRLKPDPLWMEGKDGNRFTLPNGAVRLTGELSIRDLTFGYSTMEPPLIQGFDLTLPPGARVALVGGSGSGKSTIIRLAGGLFIPWSGEILFDGIAHRNMPREVLVNSVSFVDQDIFLFEGTVRENITMWNGAIPEEQMILAAKDACLHDVVAARPGGYESRVAAGGANFSGGQRQRLEIARALCTNPSVLILDEATSALDAATEAAIDANLRRRGVTCLVATHRLSAIRDCDEILVLDKGRIVERGTHETLMALGGHYRTLIET